VLRPGDADQALRTVHRALEELSNVNHNLTSWLTWQGIYDAWPPL